MRKYPVGLLMMVLSMLAVSCQQQDAQKLADGSPQYRLNTIKDLMDSLVDPGATFIWNSVSTVVSVNGTEEKVPRTDEEWKEVRRHGIMLLEATNMLQMPGRNVAKPGQKSENPAVELAPEQIEEMINKDRASWNKYAQGLHDATMEAFKAIESKDAETLLSVSDKIDAACEKCHMHYWYPNEKLPPSQKGSN